MRKCSLALSLMATCLVILAGFVHSALADTYTKYPPYDEGRAGGDGYWQVDAAYQESHYINLLNGTVKLYAAVEGSIIYASAGARSWGYQGITWTCPGDPGGGGGCPYVSAWNGSKYVLDNNVLPTSESTRGDVEDFYLLQQPVASEGNKYKLQLSEFEHEHDFFDEVKLFSANPHAGVSVAVSSDGRILTFESPHPPVSAVTNEHQNVKQLLEQADGNYYQGHNGSYIELNFGDELDISNGAKLVMRTDMKCEEVCVLVQVQNCTGAWNTVGSATPRHFWSTDIVDMSSYLPDAMGRLKVRLYFTLNHKLDFVGLDTSTQADIEIEPAELLSAQHSMEGDVTSKLLSGDHSYAELRPGKQIELTFNASDSSPSSSKILYVKGHYFGTSEEDPIVTVTSKLSLNGHVGGYAAAIVPFASTCAYRFQVWLEVYDVTADAYNTETLIYEKSGEAWGGPIQFLDYTWNYDQDFTATFSADGSHEYHIYIGVYIEVTGQTIGAPGFVAAINFGPAPNDFGIVTRYIDLSW